MVAGKPSGALGVQDGDVQCTEPLPRSRARDISGDVERARELSKTGFRR